MNERLGPTLFDLVPHRPPMLWLDAIVCEDERSATSRTRFSATCPFARDGAVPATVALELMAQTIAAFLGGRRHREGHAARGGVLAGVRNAHLAVDSFALGEELFTRVEHVYGDGRGATFRGLVTRGGAEVATAFLTVFENAEDDEP